MQPILLAVCLLLITPITGSWWASGSYVVMDPHAVCKKHRRLRGRLAGICKNETKVLNEISRGVALGTEECGHQFRNRRWNCTTVRRSMRKILMKDTRETGFVNAITAAGITFAITRACTTGDLPDCSCDNRRIPMSKEGGGGRKKNRRQKHRKMLGKNGGGGGGGMKHRNMPGRRITIHKESITLPTPMGTLPTGVSLASLPPGVAGAGKVDWEWSGCGENIHYAYVKSRDFMDARYRRRSDIKTLVKLHNNEAGRLAIKDHMRAECKCHGLSGSCTLRTCWYKMPPFREVGNRLKERFDGAAKVIAANDGNRFMPEGDTIKPPTRADIVYTEESPDFCRFNHKTGSLGTQGRTCNSSSQGVDGCDLLCCSRGSVSKWINKSVHCNCKFEWCCHVNCDTCNERMEVFTCT